MTDSHPIDGDTGSNDQAAPRPRRRKPRRPGKAGPSAPHGTPGALFDAESPSASSPPESLPRLQKFLAAAGLGSRRQCEEIIVSGRVEVDGKAVTALGTRIDPASQEVRVDGERVGKFRAVYFAVNKPVGVVTTNFDPAGRTRVIDLLPGVEERVFPIGRLDKDSEGLILVTNDGELANQVTHPRYGVEKTYLVQIAGSVDYEELSRLKQGVFLAEGFARVVRVAIRSSHGKSTWAEIVLDEGRNREIRRLLARVGHKVLRLKRIAVGPVKIGDLPVGAFRTLHAGELRELRAAASGGRRRRKPTREGAARVAATGTDVPSEGAGGEATPPPKTVEPPFAIVIKSRRLRTEKQDQRARGRKHRPAGAGQESRTKDKRGAAPGKVARRGEGRGQVLDAGGKPQRGRPAASTAARTRKARPGKQRQRRKPS